MRAPNTTTHWCVCARVRLMTMLMNQPFLFFLSLSISEEVKIQFLIQLNHVFDCIIIICLHEEDDKKSAHLSVWILDAYWEKQLNNTIFPFSMEWIERTLLTTFSYTQPLGFFSSSSFFLKKWTTIIRYFSQTILNVSLQFIEELCRTWKTSHYLVIFYLPNFFFILDYKKFVFVLLCVKSFQIACSIFFIVKF